MPTKLIEYYDSDTLLEGFLAIPNNVTDKTPAVLVTHDWSGRNEFACKKAEQLAELGYIGFALDMYGKGKFGQTKEEKIALMSPLAENRQALQQRMHAGLTILKQQPHVDSKRIGAIGFCFGGLCVLDLARSGADIAGIVSFHGLLNAPSNIHNSVIKAKILVLHGHDDPMVPSEQVLAFQQEMTQAKADWQMIIYGDTMHAFTNPIANDPGFGTVYNACADKRSWLAMKNFFSEIF